MSPRAVAALAALGVLVIGGAGVAAFALSGKRRAPLVAGDSVLLLGDSLGVGMSQGLADALAAHGIVLDSEARVGWTASRVRQQYEPSSMLTSSAVVISLGSNDAALTDPTSEASDVASIVALARARGAKRILWVIPPNFSLAAPPAPATKEKQRAFLALAEAQGVEFLQPSQAVLAQLGGDHIHLAPDGYRLLGAEAANALTAA